MRKSDDVVWARSRRTVVEQGVEGVCSRFPAIAPAQALVDAVASPRIANLREAGWS